MRDDDWQVIWRRLLPLFLVFLAWPGQAQQPDTKNLRVGVFVEDPFVMRVGNGYEGFCIELWTRIMEQHEWKCAYTLFSSPMEILEKIKAGELDVAVGPFYVTSERVKTMDFSHPFHESGLQLMINTERHHTLGKLWQGLVEGGHIKILLAGAGIILLLTHLLLFFEWKTNPAFPRGYLDGFSDCFYHVMSICMQGKATHRGLPGAWGRILAALWLAGGVAVVAYITSTLTAVMTANKLRGTVHGIKDLAGQTVAVIQGTVSEKAAQKYGVVTVPYPSVAEAADAVVKRNVAAVVFDTFALRYYDRLHPELPIGEIGPVFEKGAVSFAMPMGSKLRQPINHSLLRLKEDGVMQLLDSKYFEAAEN